MTDLPRHSVSVAGIVVNDAGEVLVIRRRDNGHWEPPGGVLELGETFEEGVQREVLEETGITVQVDKLTGIYKNMKRGIVALVFRCAPLNEPVSATPEATEVKWVPIAEAGQLMTAAYAVRVIDAFSSAEPQVRSHDGVDILDI